VRTDTEFVGAPQPTELPAGSLLRMEQELQAESRFRTHWYNRTPRYWLAGNLTQLKGVRDSPEVFRLEVEPGVNPNHLPPVRIFIGSEAGQSRGDRVLAWSVIQTRDPARVYELYFMKDLKGYDRSAWKTGSSNYRYGVPAMTGGKGRAIYNDTNQIYFTDPGELFDLDMGSEGILSITEHEVSVMLIDCERMLPHWTLGDAQHGKQHGHFREIVQKNKLWARLPAEWNTESGEFVAARSKCLHFEMQSTQPRRALQNPVRHEPHLGSELWLACERSADAAGFMIFTKDKPSRRYGEIVAQYRNLHEGGAVNLSLAAADTFDGHSSRKHQDDILALIQSTGARSVLDFGAGKGSGYRPSETNGAPTASRVNPAWPDVQVTCYDPGFEPFSSPYTGKFDGVICTDVLEHIPEEDIPWVLDELFKSAKSFVYASAACYPARKKLPNGENAHVTQQPPAWWTTWFTIVARRYPAIRWKLCSIEKGIFGKTKQFSDGRAQMAKVT
jgi:hypothetical protein